MYMIGSHELVTASFPCCEENAPRQRIRMMRSEIGERPNKIRVGAVCDAAGVY